MTSDLIKRMVVETVFLENTSERIAFKRLAGPGKNWFAKFKGETEYFIKGSAVIVVDAFLEEKYLTEAQYKSY